MSGVEPVPPGRRVLFGFLFVLALLGAAAETLVSPFFPAIRRDLGLRVSDQALLAGVLTCSVAVGNLVGGYVGARWSERRVLRLAAVGLAAGSLGSAAAVGLAPLAVAQAVTGVGVGFIFGPTLSSVSRLYVANRGRAIAGFGLSYSLGLTLAALSAGAFAVSSGGAWRWVFVAVALVAAAFAVSVPHLVEPPGGTAAREPALAALRAYLRIPQYRLALGLGFAAGTTHYGVIGLMPTWFDDRGRSVGLVVTLIGAGRIGSLASKVAGGWLFDRRGGPVACAAMLAGIVCLGAVVLLAPDPVALAAIVPFVTCSATLFPLTSALVAGVLPARASWGLGAYRASMMAFAAVAASVMGVALRVATPRVVMLAALAPAALALVATVREDRTADPAGPRATAPGVTQPVTVPR